MGLVSWASAKSCCASISEALAESMEAWSLASCPALSEAAEVLPREVAAPPVEVDPEPALGVDPPVLLASVGAELGWLAVDPEAELLPDPAVVAVDPAPDALEPPEGSAEALDEDAELSNLANAVSA